MLTADRQLAQLKRWTEWAQTEGGLEGPVHLTTYLRPEQQRRIEWLKARATGRILEVGCSWGYVLAQCGGHVGVDINPHLIDLARVLSPDKEFHVMDATQMSFPINSFDTVMLTEVLEHIDRSQVGAVLLRAINIASKRLLITIPNGTHETEEALSFKHRWLCDAENLDWLLSFLPRPKIITGTPFIFIESKVG